MQPVLGRREQQFGAPGHRLDEQRRPADVGGGVRVRDGGGQQAPGDLGQHRRGGNEHHRDDQLAGDEGDRVRVLAAVGPGDGEAAEQAGGDVVRVALDLGGQGEHRRVVQLLGAADGYRAGGDDPGADRGGGGAEAAPVRNPVGADHLQAPGLAAEAVEGRAHGTDQQVALVPGEGGRALARDVDIQARLGDSDHDIVVQTQREAERVEPGAEIGTGRGDPDTGGSGAEGGAGHVAGAPDVGKRTLGGCGRDG